MTDPSRVAVIGDVGGHQDALYAELVRLGADRASGRLPADLIVVQVGDLIHRGPDSEGVIAMVDSYLKSQPGQWIQLVGNHEAQYLREPAFEWPERIDGDSERQLLHWWSTGLMRAAVALHTAYGDYLVTHAGLTCGFWTELGSPPQVDVAARAVNDLIRLDSAQLFRAGEMLGARRSFSAGPLWASAARELVPSWADQHLPFHQIHGHSMIHDRWRDVLRGDQAVAQHTSVDLSTGHETTTLGEKTIVGIDPTHGTQPRDSWAAWEAPLRSWAW